MALREIRWHGRGGQGVVTAARLLAAAALLEGKHVQAFPEFGPERMGAPVRAFTRISDTPIHNHSQVYEPDIVVVLDSTLLKSEDVTKGLKGGGKLIINTRAGPAQFKKHIDSKAINIFTVDATQIALDVLGKAIFNTAMLGALVKVTGFVSLTSLNRVMVDRFGKAIAQKNIAAAKRAHLEVRGKWAG
jgi:2-oxoacid:acceptor oxidoreductase gamma subunit (pyruvate/2-ketoisovalerate family)